MLEMRESAPNRPRALVFPAPQFLTPCLSFGFRVRKGVPKSSSLDCYKRGCRTLDEVACDAWLSFDDCEERTICTRLLKQGCSQPKYDKHNATVAFVYVVSFGFPLPEPNCFPSSLGAKLGWLTCSSCCSVALRFWRSCPCLQGAAKGSFAIIGTLRHASPRNISQRRGIEIKRNSRGSGLRSGATRAHVWPQKRL